MVMQLKEYSCSGNQRDIELCDGQSAILIEEKKNHKLVLHASSYFAGHDFYFLFAKF